MLVVACNRKFNMLNADSIIVFTKGKKRHYKCSPGKYTIASTGHVTRWNSCSGGSFISIHKALVVVLRVFTLPCSTTVCGSFHCQPLRLRSCIVSGPLIGQLPPADLIAYSWGPVRGSGCIRKCYFTLPSVGVFVNALSHSCINVVH